MKQQLEQARSQLNKRLQPAFEWYASREPREQTILQLLAAVIVLFLIYALIWQPIWNARESARQRYVANEQTRQWIELNAVRIQLEDQPANAVLIWLHFLEEQGLNLGTLELGPGNESGTATLRASLSR